MSAVNPVVLHSAVLTWPPGEGVVGVGWEGVGRTGWRVVG